LDLAKSQVEDSGLGRRFSGPGFFAGWDYKSGNFRELYRSHEISIGSRYLAHSDVGHGSDDDVSGKRRMDSIPAVGLWDSGCRLAVVSVAR
jgi:hypothetical protein